MTGNEIRQKYLEFFSARGHAVVPSASLLPENDPSTLFVGSGMQPMVPYLLGETHPAGRRIADSQKCFRSEDIEEVGDNRHNTFFEMLGNWSLGDYFKAEQIPWMFDFLTQQLKLEPHRLYITVFCGNDTLGIGRDAESVELWRAEFKKAGIDAPDIDFAERDGMGEGRIFYYDERKNWWSRSGTPDKMPAGEPGGPDSEMFYDLGAELKRHEYSTWKDQPCHVNCDCGRFIEIGNNVFMEYVKTKSGFEKLPQKNVDFGGGLERMTMVAQGTDNIFETDLFAPIIAAITELSGGKQYRENMRPFEVVADHLKAAVMILGDEGGVGPANTGAGYIVRRLVRRAVRYAKQLGITKNFTVGIADKIIAIYADVYPEVKNNTQFIKDELQKEEDKFRQTLAQGEKMFQKMSDGPNDTQGAGKRISGSEAFTLFATYGFPFELTQELAHEQGYSVDEAEFKQELAKHSELSKTASAGQFKGGLADTSDKTKQLHTAAHLMLEALRRVVGEHVKQKGSNITSERLRFDVSHPEKITSGQIQQVEDMVNEQIQKQLPVHFEEMPLDAARKIKATGVFDHKYGEKVKVYFVGEGEKNFSKEICGGPHVDNTGDIKGEFKITKEQSSSAGVRRIKAALR